MRASLDVAALREALLGSGGPWSGLDVHDELDSTNAEAAGLGRPWHVVVADHQRAGRGRLGRSWVAAPGAALTVSVLLPVPAAPLGWLPLLTGLAVAEAVTEVAAVRTGLKWPNDVLAAPDGWRKLSGVLCESTPAGLVVVGIGVNVAQTRPELPVDTATSLALCGAPRVCREDLLVSILGHLADRYAAWSGSAAARRETQAAYRLACATIGREVELHLAGHVVRRATATGVDEDGRLSVRYEGEEHLLAAGDVVHVRGDGGPGEAG